MKLCSTSIRFRRLILLRKKIEKHRFNWKTTTRLQVKHSTATAGMKLQSIIPRALNDNEYALMSTLDAHRCGEFKTDHQKTYHGLAQ